MLIPRMIFDSHAMVYTEMLPDGYLLLHHKKPDGWRCATCDDPNCPWLWHQYFPQPKKKRS